MCLYIQSKVPNNQCAATKGTNFDYSYVNLLQIIFLPSNKHRNSSGFISIKIKETHIASILKNSFSIQMEIKEVILILKKRSKEYHAKKIPRSSFYRLLLATRVFHSHNTWKLNKNIPFYSQYHLPAGEEEHTTDTKHSHVFPLMWKS